MAAIHGLCFLPTADIRQLHRPAEIQEFRAIARRNFLAADRASGNDAVVKTRDKLAKQQTAFISLRQFQIRAGDGSPAQS